MADPTIANPGLTDYKVEAKTMSGGPELQAVELATGVEGGARTDLAKAIGDAFAAAMFTVAWGVRKDTAAALSGVADGDVTVPIFDALNQMFVNIGSMPGAARTTDSISAAPATDAIMNGLVACTPKFKVIDNATGGDNTLVAAVASKKVRVHQMMLVAAGAVTARLESGAGGTALTGQMNLDALSGFVLPFSPMGWFETAVNTLLNLELSGAVSVDGVLGYTEV